MNTGEFFREGGQARIFSVRDATNARSGTFALKELRNPKRQARFSAEIAAVASLQQSDSVIRLVDPGIFARKSRASYYVMDRADCNLAEHLAAGDLDLPSRFALFDDICRGVTHIHAHGILHRDLKPENVLLISQKAKIADFGLCLFRDAPRVTPSWEAVGARYYMAPELEDGVNLAVDRRADIYALGKILYFILSGGRVFAREKYLASECELSRILNDPRYRLFNDVFRASIVEDPSKRADHVAALHGTFITARDAFLSHPRTRLYRIYPTFPDILCSRVPLSDLDSTRLADDELNELLSVLVQHKLPLAEQFSMQLLTRLTPRSTPFFISVLEQSDFGDEPLEQVAVVIFSRAALARSCYSFSSGHGNLGLRLARLALSANPRATAQHIASAEGLKIDQDEAVLSSLLDNFHRLKTKARHRVLVAARRLRSDAIRDRVATLVHRRDMTPLALRLLVAALADADSDRTFAALAGLMRTAHGDLARTKDIVWGLAWSGDPNVISRLRRETWISEHLTQSLSILDAACQVNDHIDVYSRLSKVFSPHARLFGAAQSP